MTLPNLSSFKFSALIPSPNKCSMALSAKNCENKYNGLETNSSPCKMIALTTTPALTFSLLSVESSSLIFSTIPISSIIPATIPK